MRENIIKFCVSLCCCCDRFCIIFFAFRVVFSRTISSSFFVEFYVTSPYQCVYANENTRTFLYFFMCRSGREWTMWCESIDSGWKNGNFVWKCQVKSRLTMYAYMIMFSFLLKYYVCKYERKCTPHIMFCCFSVGAFIHFVWKCAYTCTDGVLLLLFLLLFCFLLLSFLSAFALSHFINWWLFVIMSRCWYYILFWCWLDARVVICISYVYITFFSPFTLVGYIGTICMCSYRHIYWWACSNT